MLKSMSGGITCGTAGCFALLVNCPNKVGMLFFEVFVVRATPGSFYSSYDFGQTCRTFNKVFSVFNLFVTIRPNVNADLCIFSHFNF